MVHFTEGFLIQAVFFPDSVAEAETNLTTSTAKINFHSPSEVQNVHIGPESDISVKPNILRFEENRINSFEISNSFQPKWEL